MTSATPSRARPPYPLWLVALGSLLWIYLRLWDYTVDDTWISLRYARNLAAGHGLVYNPGERVEGYTNFLWTVLLSLPHLARIDPVPFLKLANLALALGAAAVLLRIGRRSLLGDAPRLAFLPPALFLCSPAVAISAVEGLENMLLIALLLLAVALTLEAAHPGARSSAGAALALAGACLVRPDAIPIAAWVLLVGAWLQRRARAILLPGALVAAIVAAHFLGRYGYYGDWLPNSFHAKGGGAAANLARSGGHLTAFLREYGAGWWLVALAALAPRGRRAAAVLLAGIVGLRIAFDAWSGGAWMGHHRFLVPALPFVHLLVAAGIAALWPEGAWRWIGAAAIAAGLLAPAWHAYPSWEQRYQRYAAGLTRAHIAFGHEVRQDAPPGILLAMDDAGAGPYYADRPNLDMLGLNDRHMARLPGAFYTRSDPAYVLERSPDLVVLLGRVANPAAASDFLIAAHGDLFADPGFRARYRVVRTYRFADDYHLVVHARVGLTGVGARFTPPGSFGFAGAAPR